MAAAYADSMENIGLPPLDPSACALAFDHSGYAGQFVCANIDLSRFAKVNQTRSKWSYIATLPFIPEVIPTTVLHQLLDCKPLPVELVLQLHNDLLSLAAVMALMYAAVYITSVEPS